MEQENETRLEELNYMMEERLNGLQRGLSDQIDGVTGQQPLNKVIPS